MGKYNEAFNHRRCASNRVWFLVCLFLHQLFYRSVEYLGLNGPLRLSNGREFAMAKIYTITLECEKAALAELIATGLEEHARIVEVVGKEEAKPALNVVAGGASGKVAASAVTFPTQIKATKPTRAGYKQRITCWEVYETLLKQFNGAQREFNTSMAIRACEQVAQKELTHGSISAHLYRLTSMAVLKRNHDGKQYSYQIAATVNKQKFEKMQTYARLRS